jgi:hypothetical protein
MKTQTPTRRSRLAPARLAACALLSLALFAVVAAQSGRRKPTQGVSKVPPAQGTSAPAGESESGSESKSGAAEAKKPSAVVSFVVMEQDYVVTAIDFRAMSGVREQFQRRLGQSPAVSVTPGAKGSRKDARERAKKETEAYVVLFHLDEQGMTSVGNSDSRGLVLRVYTFAPKTGDIKYHDTVYQRPYRSTAKVGGIRLPTPTIDRYPSQHELEQAARDAADRLLTRFHIQIPNN